MPVALPSSLLLIILKKAISLGDHREHGDNQEPIVKIPITLRV